MKLNSNWIIDFRGPGDAHMYGIERFVAVRSTAYQYVEIADTECYGRALFIDGIPQSAESDEVIYHEAIVHPALVNQVAPRRVLIIGGGEGATLREVLRYDTVEQVTMVDIDEELVDMAKAHLSSWHQGAFDDSRVQLEFADGRNWLAASSSTYDCIIVDSTSPTEGGPARSLFTIEFYQLAKAHLDHGGMLAVQAGCASYGALAAHSAIIHTLRQVFAYVHPYHVSVPFFGVEWAFALATDKDLKPVGEPKQIDQALRNHGISSDLRFYDGLTHQRIFSISKLARDYLAGFRLAVPLSDANPLTSALAGSLATSADGQE